MVFGKLITMSLARVATLVQLLGFILLLPGFYEYTNQLLNGLWKKIRYGNNLSISDNKFQITYYYVYEITSIILTIFAAYIALTFSQGSTFERIVFFTRIVFAFVFPAAILIYVLTSVITRSVGGFIFSIFTLYALPVILGIPEINISNYLSFVLTANFFDLMIVPTFKYFLLNLITQMILFALQYLFKKKLNFNVLSNVSKQYVSTLGIIITLIGFILQFASTP